MLPLVIRNAQNLRGEDGTFDIYSQCAFWGSLLRVPRNSRQNDIEFSSDTLRIWRAGSRIPCRQHANPLLPTTWTTSVTIKRSDDACQEMLQKWTIFDPRQVPLWCRARFELDQTLWITGPRHIRTAFLSLCSPVLLIITLNIDQSCEKMDNFDWSRDVVGHRGKTIEKRMSVESLPLSSPSPMPPCT